MHDFPPAAYKNVVVVSEGPGRIVGAAYFGRQIVIAADPIAIAPLAAHHIQTRQRARMIVGPRDAVRKFWKLTEHQLGPPRIVRDRQLVMMVDRRRLRSYDDRVVVRYAEVSDLSAVAEGSASMIRHELEYDPRRDSAGFDAGVRQMIERKLWWVGSSGGTLCFFCNVGPWSDRTAQLQGIWTPPNLRGQGLATASLSALCHRLLKLSPTLSLYVNDFNEAAIALYRRVGFEHVGDFQTILF